MDATQTAAPAGLTLPCLRCGEPDASVSVNLYDLGGGTAFECRDCDATWSLDDVRALVARWSAVLAWAEQAPRFGPRG